MKENKEETGKDTFKEVLKNYYDRYISYERAYEKQGELRDRMSEELKEVLQSTEDSSSQKFKNIVKEHIMMNSMHSAEVSNAATKFCIVADVYQIVTEEELSEEMAKKYMLLKQNEYKSNFSIVDGNFVKNEKTELPEIPQEEYDFLFEYFEKQFSEE